MTSSLSFNSLLAPAGTTPVGMKTLLKNLLVAAGVAWQVVRDGEEMNPFTLTTDFSGANAALAVDDNFSTYATHVGTAETTAYVDFDFGSGITKTINRFRVQFANGKLASNVALHYSDNGTDYTALQSYPLTDVLMMGGAIDLAVTAPVAHRFWRLVFTIPAGATEINLVTAKLFNAAGSATSSVMYMDVLPPTTEQFGVTAAREFLRVGFTNITVTFQALVEYLTDQPQVYVLYEKTAGNVQYGVTIEGVTVSQVAGTMNASNTAKQNLRHLYNALRATADATINKWKFEYLPASPANGEDTHDYILCTQITPASNVVITPNSDTNGGYIGTFTQAPVIEPMSPDFAHTPVSLTVDLATDGWVYSLQVSNRTLVLGSKTSTAYSPALWACWKKHADAVATVPVEGNCTPIELHCGTFNSDSSLTATMRVSHTYMIPNITEQGALDHTVGMGCSRANRAIVRFQPTDGPAMNGASGLANPIEIGVSGIWSTGTGHLEAANDFMIHRVSDSRSFTFPYLENSTKYGTLFIAAPILDDVFKFIGTATDEQLLVGADSQATSALTADLDDSTSYNYIPVSSNASFASAGYVVINGEIWQYTGKGTNTLTGATRNKHNTPMVKSWTGDKVYQALWFSKHLGAAILAGFNRPS